MRKSYTTAERKHLERIKGMAFVVCKTPGPSEAHHVKQDSAYHCVPLCTDCHRGPMLGIHGQKRAWAIAKMDETDALAETIRSLS